MKMKIFSNTVIAIAFTLALSSCVSTKKFDAQAQTLSETRQRLLSAELAQKQLEMELKTTQDSLNNRISLLNKEASLQEYTLFKTAVTTGDYAFASNCLQRILVFDSSNAFWAYDSLALYHYLYLLTPGQAKRSPAAMYYTEQGLKLNPKNTFLLEIKGKLLIESGQDTAAYALFSDLWKKTGDYTFLWDLTYIDLYLYGKVKEVESRITEVVGKSEASIKTVRVDQVEERVIESINAKAAFLYLRGIILAEQGNKTKAIKTFEEVIKLAPNYMSAQRALYQMKNPQYR